MAKISIPIQVNLADDWIDQIIDRMKNDPDGEFVQVVRCKDCEYFHRRQSMFGKEYTECDLYCAMQPGEEDTVPEEN